ncbi:MAG TPA: hypothetical protein PLV25_02335, partial [Opitutales bacterium]|nr:hypothetical protein [Opitutales bacterium]
MTFNRSGLFLWVFVLCGFGGFAQAQPSGDRQQWLASMQRSLQQAACWVGMEARDRERYYGSSQEVVRAVQLLTSQHSEAIFWCKIIYLVDRLEQETQAHTLIEPLLRWITLPDPDVDIQSVLQAIRHCYPGAAEGWLEWIFVAAGWKRVAAQDAVRV